MAERFLAEPNPQVQAAVLKRIDDADWAVRRAAGRVPRCAAAGARETALTSLLEKHAGDPVVVDAALSGLRGGEAAVLTNLLQSTAQSPTRETAITMLTATLVRSAQDAAVQAVFERVADTDAARMAACGDPARRGSRAPRRRGTRHAAGTRRPRRRGGGRAWRRSDGAGRPGRPWRRARVSARGRRRTGRGGGRRRCGRLVRRDAADAAGAEAAGISCA